MKKGCLIFLVLILSLSCDRQRVFEEFRPIKGQTWNSNEVMHFNVNINDTTTAHNVYISIRNTGDYEYSNIYLFVTAHSPNGSQVRDTIEITLADEHGKWLGKGAASIFTLYHPYRENIRFPFHGIYQFDLEQAMWIKDLKHISNIGLRVEKVRESR
jgi:gliding motility-associated lipoprotein GldH